MEVDEIMEDKINWNREDYWNEYDIYDDYFLSFHFDHCQVEEDKWKELVKKWNLDTKVTIGDSRYNPESENISIYNDDYSMVISGINYDGFPGHGLMLTFNRNIDMKTCIKFFREFRSALDYYDDMTVREGITGEYTSHPKDISKIMIDKL